MLESLLQNIELFLSDPKVPTVVVYCFGKLKPTNLTRDSILFHEGLILAEEVLSTYVQKCSDPKKHMILVLDDCISAFMGLSQAEQLKYTSIFLEQTRKLGITILLTYQEVFPDNDLLRLLKSQATGILIFDCRTEKQSVNRLVGKAMQSKSERTNFWLAYTDCFRSGRKYIYLDFSFHSIDKYNLRNFLFATNVPHLTAQQKNIFDPENARTYSTSD